MRRIDMRRISVWVPALVLIATVVAPAAEQDEAPKSKEAKVRELLVLTGAADLGKQTMDSMLEQLRTMPMPPGFIDRFKKAARPDDLVELIVPIYMKHLDVETIDAMLAFYRTPAGQKAIRALPVINREAMEAGRQWGVQLARKVLEGAEDEPTPTAPTATYRLSKQDDMNSVRFFVALLVACGTIPMKDARVDVLALARGDDVPRSMFSVFRSARFHIGPSEAEVARGDYTNFPYERFKGTVTPGKVVPLLWDRKPDEQNGRVVGFSNGEVKYLAERDVQALLKQHGQLPPPQKPER